MSLLLPRAVLARVASQLPEACRAKMIVVGSLAAAYQLVGKEAGGAVRTKDIDCLLVPRVEAVRVGLSVAETLLARGWRRSEGQHGEPGTPDTPDADLPVIRLNPPDTADWYIELLSVVDAGDERDRVFDRVVLGDGGHYAVASFRYLDVGAYQPSETPEGLRCARLAMLALSNLLRNPSIRPERMLDGARRSNKDLGRVLTIAHLAGRSAVKRWPGEWADALQALYGERWPQMGSGAGQGVQALLASEGDLAEALELSRLGLLANVPMAADEFRIVGERLVVDALEPLAKLARDR